MRRGFLQQLAISVAFLALALGAVAPSLAQDGGAFPFFYVVSSEIKPGMGSTYALAIAQVVAANKSSENGSNFATFVNVTGEGAVYNHFIAMQSLGEMDNLSLPGLLIAELGPEKGGQVLESLASSADSTTRVLKFMPQLSKMPSQPAMAPPPMVLHVGYQIPAESVAEFNQVAAKYVGATRENAKAPASVGYNTVVGGEDFEYSFFISLSKWGDMDGMATPREVSIDAFGLQGAAQLGDKASELATASLQLFAYVPELSNIPMQ